MVMHFEQAAHACIQHKSTTADIVLNKLVFLHACELSQMANP